MAEKENAEVMPLDWDAPRCAWQQTSARAHTHTSTHTDTHTDRQIHTHTHHTHSGYAAASGRCHHQSIGQGTTSHCFGCTSAMNYYAVGPTSTKTDAFFEHLRQGKSVDLTD